MGSKQEDLIGEFLISLSSSASVRILNLVKVVVVGGSAETLSRGVGRSVAVANDDWILETLSEKNCAKSLARSRGESCFGRIGSLVVWRSLSAILNTAP